MAGTVDTQNSTNQGIIESANQATSTQTSRGTTIVKAGDDMDKNAFLKILSAELSNQDPENASDGTQYVAQMAQFSELEQLANLNSTMRMTGANDLIGKHVTLDKVDDNGNLYSGEVQDVVKDGDNIDIDVIVGTKKDSSGNTVNDVQKFDLDDLNSIDSSSSQSSSTSNVTSS